MESLFSLINGAFMFWKVMEADDYEKDFHVVW